MRYVCARSFFARSCLIALCAAAILVLSALPAFAATSYTNPLPAPDSATAVTKPPVKCTVTDPAGVNTTSLIMKLDGLNVRGKWSGSTVTYTPLNPIANGTHTVSVSVLNCARRALHVHVELHGGGRALRSERWPRPTAPWSRSRTPRSRR